MSTLIDDNQLVFAEYNIGDKLRINYRDGTVIFGILMDSCITHVVK